ncbi:DUF2510 domain-containing protein [Mycobacterium europaeum]|uniref:DUF2510 domain-containing protein n=1 Tax=Mycobacterium europaeum TaxID=761804 RepID=UPI00114FA071
MPRLARKGSGEQNAITRPVSKTGKIACEDAALRWALVHRGKIVTTPAPWPGWYPDPEDADRHRCWDGTAWAQRQYGSISTGQFQAQGQTAIDVGPPHRNRKNSALAIARGISFIVLALSFGSILYPSATRWPTTVVDAYFLAAFTLCVVIFVLGVLSLVRPAAHPVYSVIAGATVIVIGVIGCILSVLHSHETDVSLMIILLFFGVSFAIGGAIATLLSGIILALQRHSRARPPARPRPLGAQSGTLGSSD